MSRRDESGSRRDSCLIRSIAAGLHTPCRDRRSIKFVQPVDCSDEEEDFESLRDVCGKTWKVFTVSPLHRFKYDPLHLRHYGKKLREYLSHVMAKDNNMQYNATFSVVDDLARGPNDCKAVRVKVTTSRDEQVGKQQYEGLLLSWGSTHPPSDVVHLPLMLVRGSLGLTNAVHSILAQFFDCHIGRFSLSEEEVFWLSAMLPALCSPTRKGSLVQFEYNLPSVANLSAIVLQCPLQCLRELWQRIHDEGMDELLFSNIAMLYEGLAEHFHQAYSIDIGKCTLYKIKSIDLHLASNGMLKMSSTTLADRILNFLCNTSIILEDARTTLSVKDD